MTPDEQMTEARLIDIEIKITRQEDLLESLNQVVYQQQKKIDKLEALCAVLSRHAQDAPGSEGERNAAQDKPPHY